jgi:hypothetical protein
MISAVIANPGRPARLLVSRSDLVWHPLQQDTPVELLFASQTPKMCLCVCVCVSEILVCASFVIFLAPKVDRLEKLHMYL